jgi:serine/threonine protein kinase/tetratricopeptide (TPR) repeat protein
VDESLDRLESLFAAALEKPAAERAAYLEQACAGDAALGRRLDALLRAREAAGSFLEAPAHALAPAEEPFSERPGVAVGPYKLLEQIGEGGFGVVFLAEQQQPIRRKVALKVLKPGMDTRQVVARFEAERQALALMEHPHIAKVHDGGATASGRPYFVMELVKGAPVTDFCDQGRLGVRERLELFVSVCQAVQHAHQKGVIHRDIKPSNVLVTLHDAKAVPKVIDFGVAKALGQALTDKTVFTGLAQMIGTPLYMSPEQAGTSELDVDTRSDVYSLGVLLYELLTGTTPFEKNRFSQVGYDEMRRIIREEEPARPSTRLSTLGQAATTASANRQSDPKRLSRLFRGELDWVVMKALEKDRGRRYESASAFAADVQRYLADEPVLACPPSAGYRLRKFVRRHKGPVLAGGAFVLLLGAGVAGTTAGLVQTLAAERRAVAERDEKQEAWRQTRRALNTTTDHVLEDLLGRQAELTDRHRDFLKKALAFHAAFAAAKGDDAEGRQARAEGYFRVGRIRHFLGEYPDSEAAYRGALALQEGLANEPPGRPEFSRELADTEDNLGLLLCETARLTEAEAAHRDALARRQRLAADLPDRPDLRRDLARSHLNLGIVLRETGRLPEAAAAYREAMALSKQLVAESPRRPDYRQGLARSYNNLANVLRETGPLPEAEAALREALALHQRLADDFPNDPDHRRELALGHHNLATLLLHTGRLPEAEAAHRTALGIQKRLAADFLARPEYRQDLARTHIRLGALLAATGRLAEAEAPCRDALALLKRLAADVPARPDFRHGLATSRNSLSNLLHATGRLPEAEAACRDALAVLKRLTADFPARADFRQDLGGAHYNLANLLRAAGKLPEAEATHHDALALRERLAADFPDRPDFRRDLALSHLNLGTLLRDTRRPKEAEAAYQAALALLRPLAAGSPRPDFRHNLAKTLNNLGLLRAEEKNYPEAKKLYDEALALHQRLADDFPTSPEHRNNLATTLLNVAILHNHRKEYTAAVALVGQARPHFQAALGANPRSPDYRRCWQGNLRVLAWAQHDRADHAGLAATADELARFVCDPPSGACHAVRYLCLCVGLANKDARLDRAKREELAKGYAEKALALLRQAAAGAPDGASGRPQYLRQLASCSAEVSQQLRADGRPKEAEAADRAGLALLQRLVKDFPAPPDFRHELARGHFKLGNLLYTAGRSKEAEAAYRDALALRQQLADQSPKVADYQNELAGTLVNLGMVHNQRREFAAAIPFLERAVPHHQAALKAAPTNRTYRQFYRNNLRTLAQSQLGLADHARLAGTADELARFGYDPTNDTYLAACFLSRCVALAERDAQLDEARRKGLAESYAGKALALLLRAAARGYRDAARLKKDPDLQPLRAREEFRQLLAGLEGKAGG